MVTAAFFGHAANLLEQGFARSVDVYSFPGLYDYAVQFDYDQGFYLEAARAAPGPILDLACGSGRMLLPLAEAGFDCEGLDVSRDMLDLAAAKLAAYGLTAALHQADMRSFCLRRSFGAVFIPYQSMMYMLTTDDRKQTLERVYAHLLPGGVVAFDFDASAPKPGRGMPYLALQGIHPLRQCPLVQIVQIQGFADGRRLLNQINYEVSAPPRITVQSAWEASCPAPVMAELVAAAGFEDIVQYADFEQNAYGGGAQCIIRARRPD